MIDLLNKSPKILVIGDLIVDHYLWGSCERISPEAPVQVVSIENENICLGGAGNVINNLKKMGADVDLIGVIGDCDVSKEVKNLLLEIKIETKYLITQKGRITSKKTRIIAEKQQVVRYDQENISEISSNSEDSIIENFEKIIGNYDVILLSDYGKGLFSFSLTQSLIKLARHNSIKILVDPKGKDYSKYKGAYLLTPNKKEACEATNISINDNQTLLKAIKQIKDNCELEVSIITLSEQGVALYDNELKIHPTAAREVFDVTGAGDTILASLGFALSCNMHIDNAIRFANLASGVAVGKIGSAAVSLNEILEYETSLKKHNKINQIKTFDQISVIVDDLKNKNKTIVFTNGCFDLLHVGHIKYLEECKNLGDVLIVGLNSDNSVKNLKGKDRPINSQDDRSYVLAALNFIDFIVIFDTKTPLELIKIIKPDILAKGGDYEGKKVVGQDLVKELKFIDFVEGKSTTKIIKKIKEF